jgi:hypothetical protein
MRAILATLLLVLSAHAAAAQTCVPAAAVLAMARSHPDYVSHAVVAEAAVKAASDIFNAVPPETDTAWTHAVLVDFRDGSGALLVGRGDDICGSLRVAPDRWQAVVSAIRGAGV